MQDLLPSLIFALLSSSVLALLALYKKSLMPGALALAWVSAAVVGFLGRWPGFLIMAATFLFTILADKIGRRKSERDKSEKRRLVQIFCNVGTGTLAFLIASLLGNTSLGLFLYASAMASSLADSMASGIGVLQKRDPVSILTFRRIPRGHSGGISFTGLSASLLGSMIIASVYTAFARSLPEFFLITSSGFLGALFDSFLGATLQGKFVCEVDGAYTEKRLCHGKPAKLSSGLFWMDNNLVNLSNNVFALLFALLLHSII